MPASKRVSPISTDQRRQAICLDYFNPLTGRILARAQALVLHWSIDAAVLGLLAAIVTAGLAWADSIIIAHLRVGGTVQLPRVRVARAHTASELVGIAIQAGFEASAADADGGVASVHVGSALRRVRGAIVGDDDVGLGCGHAEDGGSGHKNGVGQHFAMSG